MATLKIYQTDNHIKSKHLSLGEKFGNKNLTKRETEVLKYVVLGYTAKKIGKILEISFRTVEAYINNLKIKLCCTYKNNIAEIIIKNGLIHDLKLFD
ncbi:MAG: helix-turn-helix transcriptional regulator [Parachlamydiaceae bacterium]|nr:helix-turn-helix transcriptional regulator [Parachlamydiaceae bacterium]